MPSNNLIDRYRSFYGNNLIKLHSIDEAGGDSVCKDYSIKGDDSAYFNDDSTYHRYGDGLDGRRSFRQTRTKSTKINLYTAAYNTNFNKAKGSVIILAKIASSDYWSPDAGATTCMLFHTGVNATNRVAMYKANSGTPRLFAYKHEAGSITPAVTNTITGAEHGSPTGWFWAAMTWDVVGNALECYFRVAGGTLFKDTTVTGLAAWDAGSLSSTGCVLGGSSTTDATNKWDGENGLCAIWAGVALTQNDIQILTKV